jgi:hypothetical protein
MTGRAADNRSPSKTLRTTNTGGPVIALSSNVRLTICTAGGRREGALMKVLVAIDGSSQSEDAVVQVARFPWPNEVEMEVLTVIHPTIPMFAEPTLVDAAMSVQETNELRQRRRNSFRWHETRSGATRRR